MTPTSTQITTDPADLDALIPPTEPWRPIHIRLPQSTHDVVRVVAARARLSMTEMIREVMIEWAKAKRAELTEELAQAAAQHQPTKRKK